MSLAKQTSNSLQVHIKLWADISRYDICLLGRSTHCSSTPFHIRAILSPIFFVRYIQHFWNFSNTQTNNQLASEDVARTNIQPCLYHLSMLLQWVITVLDWYPSRKTGKSEFDYVHDSNGPFCQNLHRSVRIYIKAFNEYIKLGWRRGEGLDKPNAQRLVELCLHTVPIFWSSPFSIWNLYWKCFTADLRNG